MIIPQGVVIFWRYHPEFMAKRQSNRRKRRQDKSAKLNYADKDRSISPKGLLHNGISEVH